MSAPWEVWISEEGSVIKPDTKFLGHVRYLRADLTCGECKHLIAAYPEFGMRCTWKCQSSGREIPACMAFVPKEAKK